MKDILKVIVYGGLFIIPFLPVYVETHFFFPYITGKNFAFRIIVEVVFAAWILLCLYDAKYRPKFTWILAAFSGLLAVMALANALGEYPLKSFWSNFERMDGYVTLIHLFVFIVVLGSVMLTEKLWNYFLHTMAVIAGYVAIYGIVQYLGWVPGSRNRVDSQLGNAAYMAVYMLFNIFILLWLFVRTKINWARVLYALGIVLFAVTLLLTGTRGTFLGFVAGIGIAVAYIAIFGRKFPELRKIAIISCAVVVILGGGFFVARDSQYVQNIAPLKRIANISIEKDLRVRTMIWEIAYKGIKDRPLLGWGQGNFNYVFNKYYDPGLYSAESWYDRTHDIFSDWLIRGGIIGLLAYLSIWLAIAYYLVWLPLVKDDQRFSVLERAVLLGLLVGYFIHNLVVFDNIISYIFFGTILALIHMRTGEPIKVVENYRTNQRMIVQFFAPIVILVAGATVYFVNVPNILAAKDIIDAMQQKSVQGRLVKFNDALSRHSFADQEIVEQLAQQAMGIEKSSKVPDAQKKPFVQRAELELLRMNDEKPGDARLHDFLATFYRTIGALPQAKKEAEVTHELTPKKQSVIIEQGVIAIQMNDVPAALGFFKKAYELDTSNTDALVLYAATLAKSGKPDEARKLVSIDDKTFQKFAQNNYALAAVNQSGDNQFMVDLFKARIKANPNDTQNRVSLSYIYYQMDDIQSSIDTLRQAAQDIPSMATSATCFISNLKNGKAPNDGCS